MNALSLGSFSLNVHPTRGFSLVTQTKKYLTSTLNSNDIFTRRRERKAFSPYFQERKENNRIFTQAFSSDETNSNEEVQGVIVQFNPSPCGMKGLMAIQVRDESTRERKNEATEDSMKQSRSNMFDGVQQQQQKVVQEGDNLLGNTIILPNGGKGVVIAQRFPMIFVLCDSAVNADKIDKDLENTCDFKILSTAASIGVGDFLFGTTIDSNSNPVHVCDDGTVKDLKKIEEMGEHFVDRALFAPTPNVADIALIDSPLLTGYLMVDSLVPIGKGQNMLVIGEGCNDSDVEGVGQRDFLIGTLKTQLAEATKNGRSTKCVYALTTADPNVRLQVIQQLTDANLMDKIVVVTSRLSKSQSIESEDLVSFAAEGIAVAATACAIGEAFAISKGDDSLVIVDNIDQHKAFWDWTTRILVKVYGVDAVVKADIEGGASSEMRAFYSDLIQRAGRFKKEKGGGSVTLTLVTNLPGAFGGEEEDKIVFSPSDFDNSSEKVKERISILSKKGIPLIPVNLRKIQIPVPVSSDTEKERRFALQHLDDLISMSDGQIWLDEKLYKKGQRPAVDPQRSITRVGVGADIKCRPDAPAMQSVATGLRFEFAQAVGLEGAGANSGVDKQILKKNAYLFAMNQNSDNVRLLSENCVALLASSLGLLDKYVQNDGCFDQDVKLKVIQELLAHVRQSIPETMDEIDETLELTSSMQSEVESVIKQFFS